MILVVAIVLAILAPIIARFIQLAVSRQREYLADASRVELTRNPYGLERALAKIATDQEVLEVANRGTQHMYFTNPIKKFEARSSGLMDTHPPILDRINRLRQLTGEPPLPAADAAALAGLDWAVGPVGRLAPASRVDGPSRPVVSSDPPTGSRRLVDHRAEIAQLVEHATENRGVASSNLALGTTHGWTDRFGRKWLSW